jgi:alpha-ketoglutarate-dependent taurine dioxygenase
MAIAAGPITITPVPPLLGAEVGGVDLPRPLGAATVGYIVQALAANSEVLLRAVHLGGALVIAIAAFMRADGVHRLKRQVRAPSSPPRSGASTR